MNPKNFEEASKSGILEEVAQVLTRDICGIGEVHKMEIALDHWGYVSELIRQRLQEIVNDQT